MNKGTPWKTAKRLMGYVAGTLRLQFAAVCVAILVSAVAGMAGPLFLQYLIDDLIVPLASQETPDFSSLLRAVILMGCLYYEVELATPVYNCLMVHIRHGVLKRVRDEMFAHMQRLPIRYFDTHPHGEIMSLYTNDTDTLRQMISQSIPQTFYSLVSVVAIFGVMLSISIPLSILAVLMVLLMMKVTKDIGGKSGRGFIAQQTDLAKVNGYIEEMMAGQKVIKVFNHENAAKHDFDVLNEKLCQSATTANAYGNMLMPIIGNIGYLQYVLTALIGSVLSISGISAITLGALASFLQFTRNFIMPFSQISQQMNAIVMALAGAQRIFDMMDETQETDEGYVTLVNARYNHDGELVECAERTEIWAWKHPHSDGSVTYTRLCGDVRFEDMTFGYTPEKTVLHNVTLYAKPGQKLAFVGSTGAGKTTITNLINRFYDVEDGKIRYDGININKIRKDDLRRSLGIVLQDTHLFTGTIMENIRYGRLDATDEEVYAAARLANADDFIKRLPHGYETVISGEGEDLSQGQRQLLAIARAAVADPPVLILDEATSSIDTRTEAIVQDGMDRLMSGRTVFVIAHRLSTIRNSDTIMVLEHGRIIERGDHESLLAKKGTYYQLYTGALELD